MKKVIAIIMSLILILSVSVTAFAEDLSAGNGESEIKAHVYSQYTISIPAVIDLRNGDIGQVTIDNAMIEDGYAVKVFVNVEDFGGIRLVHTNGTDSIHCNFSNTENGMVANSENPLVTFVNGDLQQGTATKYFNVQAENYGTPGDYTGTMQYSFECQPNS